MVLETLNLSHSQDPNRRRQCLALRWLLLDLADYIHTPDDPTERCEPLPV